MGATRISIFSIAVGAECLSYLKSIETHARAIFKVIIFSIGSVQEVHEVHIARGSHGPLSKAIALEC